MEMPKYEAIIVILLSYSKTDFVPHTRAFVGSRSASAFNTSPAAWSRNGTVADRLQTEPTMFEH